MTNDHRPIIRGISKALDIPQRRILSQDTKREVTDARFIAYELLYDEGTRTLEEIAVIFGKANHSAISWGRRQVRDLGRTDKLFQAKLEKCRQSLTRPNSKRDR